MILDKLIQKIVPRDEKFFVLMEESTANLCKAADLMNRLMASEGSRERDRLVAEIDDLEHKGDEITHRIFSALNSTFVTPLDREDIHALTSVLDDVMDHMNGSAARFTLYKLKSIPRDMVKLVQILGHSINELHTGITFLRNLHETHKLRDILRKVNEYENEADAVFERAVAKLFDKERNPIKLIKLKEIYVSLELATDKCEDAANVLEAILIKNA